MTTEWRPVAVPDDDPETCEYCGHEITDDAPGEPCSGADKPLHADCHWHTGCRRNE